MSFTAEAPFEDCQYISDTLSGRHSVRGPLTIDDPLDLLKFSTLNSIELGRTYLYVRNVGGKV